MLVFLFAFFSPNSRAWRKGLGLIGDAKGPSHHFSNPRDYILPSVASSSDQKQSVDVIGVVVGKEH